MRISVGLAVLAALLLSACGRAANSDQAISTPTTSTGAVRTATITAPTTSPAATTTAAASTTTAPRTTTVTAPHTISTATITTPDSGGAGLSPSASVSGTSQCLASDLTLASVGPNSAPGTTVLGFTLTDTGARSCHTGGWPGVALFAAGASTPLTNSAVRATADVLGSTPDSVIVLKPGAEASFRLVLSSSGGGCHTATRAEFIAPNDTTAMSVAIPDGVQYCGRMTISPLQPGASGTGQ